MATVSDDPIRELLGVLPPQESIEWINLLIYGEPGAGKTYFVGTAQDHEDTSPLLLLDVEGGAMTLRHKKDIDVIQVRSMGQVEKAYEELRKQGDDLYYKTVAIDSLTELQKLDMRTIMKKLKAEDSRGRVDEYVPSQREWGKSNERIRLIVRAFRDLPCHVIATALYAETYEDNRAMNTHKLVAIHPSLPGKLRGEVPGFFDIVGWLQAKHMTPEGGGDKEIIRTLQTVKTEIVIAKDRSQSLDHLIKHPSVPLIWETINSE